MSTIELGQEEVAEKAAAPRPKWQRRGCFVLLLGLAALALTPLLWRKAVQAGYGRHIYTVEAAPPAPTAVVFGAAVYRNGRLSPVLRDRMETAIALYESGKVEKLIVSGSHNGALYDEPGAMQQYAITRGVAPGDVQPDYGGRRTYDTCYRARYVFGLDTAVLVTQEFHLSRALFTCRWLGIDAVGVASDLRPYRGARWYALRETAATLVALIDVVRREPPPIMDAALLLD